jgi:hypothetical protein
MNNRKNDTSATGMNTDNSTNKENKRKYLKELVSDELDEKGNGGIWLW